MPRFKSTIIPTNAGEVFSLSGGSALNRSLGQLSATTLVVESRSHRRERLAYKLGSRLASRFCEASAAAGMTRPANDEVRTLSAPRCERQGSAKGDERRALNNSNLAEIAER